MNSIKVYVDVLVEFNEDGVMLPRLITWEDGSKYEVDRVVDIRPAAAMKAGYTVMVRGTRTFLFFERNASLQGNNIGRWFVERKAG